MKVIEMLNKIAKDDKYLPKKIKFYGEIFRWNKVEADWFQKDGLGLLEYNIPYSLNNEIEVIE